MKKSTKKMVKRLSQYIGKEIIRTGRNRVNGSRSFLGEPIILKGFTNNGEIIYSFPSGSCHARIFGTNDFILELSYTDEQWKRLSKIFKPKGNELNCYIGKKIQRVRPAIYSNGVRDYSFTDSSLTLISATKYHLVVEDTTSFLLEKVTILPFEFAKPEDWVLAE